MKKIFLNLIKITAIALPISLFFLQGGYFMPQIVKIACLFLPFFIYNKTIKNNLLLGIYIASAMVAALGIAAYFGAPLGSEFAVEIYGILRLQSTFEYANTTAVICGVSAMLGL
jgi:hypothetical protein